MTNVACKKNFSSTDIVEDKTVILSEISSGDSVKIAVGRTFRIGNGGLVRFDKLNDAKVSIKEENGFSYILQPNFAPEYANNAATIYTARRRFRSNYKYSIEIKHATLGTATAKTFIPVLPSASFSDTATKNYAGKNVLSCKLVLNDVLAPDDLYMIEALKELLKVRHFFIYAGVRYDYDTPEGYSKYQTVKNLGIQIRKDTVSQKKFLRINLYTADNLSENAFMDVLNNSFRRIFYDGARVNAATHSTVVYLDPTFFAATNTTEAGRIRLKIKRCSPELFKYLLSYEKYKTDFGNLPASLLAAPDGNIAGGVGLFAGSSQRERIFYFDKLE